VTHEIVHFIANDFTMARLAASGLGGRDLSIIDLDEARSSQQPAQWPGLMRTNAS